MSQKVGRSLRVGMADRQTGGVLGMGNPGEERRLAATLRKIDREKKKRESAMTWNQRSFFIKQVFDQDNELRFVKASQRPKYLEYIPPPPPDGDTSWIKGEYVFSFDTKKKSPGEGRGHKGNRHHQEPAEEPVEEAPVDELTAVSEAQAGKENEAESKLEVVSVKDENENETKAPEKRDSFQGTFGRRQKLNMPLLMTSAWKSKNEEEKKVDDEKLEPMKEADEKLETVDEKQNESEESAPAPPILVKNTTEGSPEASKPRVKFPVLKVKALGLFAASFKKNDSFPPLPNARQSQPQLQSQPAPDTTSTLPPTLSGALTGSSSTPALTPQTAPANVEVPRPGSISLPNSPQAERKPLVRQNSDHAMHVERPGTDHVSRSLPTRGDATPRKSQQGWRRHSSIHHVERSKQHTPDKACKSASSAMPKINRNFSARPSVAGSSHSGGKEPKNSWEKVASEADSNEQAKPKRETLGFVENDNRDQDEVELKVIRRIVRTLPTQLMIKTTKREVEAGCDGAVVRQKLMDRARAEMTRRASLDPRFKNLEKSLTFPQK
ncbi:uncharacterized protein [Diadema setosum]|uniref:uncharacterized protein n=1 Tax=Diadema setosum TaxID=31175 RepID=UPI003B3AE7BB